MAVKFRNRAVTFMAETVILPHCSARNNCWVRTKEKGESPEDSNGKQKMWKNFSLEKICITLGWFKCEKPVKGALQECFSKNIV